MSESGKVSLPMTPEQIEAYKAYTQINRGLPPEMAIELLAALEESQHKVEESKIREIDLEEQYKTLHRMYTDMDVSCGETLDLLKETSLSLVEAQQTIARIQDERFQFEKSTADALSEVWRLERELRWYADEINWNQGDWEGGIFYTLADRDGGKRAQAALGNKEGEK